MNSNSGLRDLLYSKQWLEEVQGSLQPGDSALSVPEYDRVLAVVTEITFDADSGTQIVAGFANGNARLIYSNGGGLLGDLSQMADIGENAKSLVRVGQVVFSELLSVEELPPLPPANNVRFTLLTVSERRGAVVPGPELMRQEHPLYLLFEHVNKLWSSLSDLQGKLNQK